jgi:hypothetical protein
LGFFSVFGFFYFFGTRSCANTFCISLFFVHYPFVVYSLIKPLFSLCPFPLSVSF